MPRPPSPSIPEKEFFVAALQQNQRLDGRASFAPRDISLEFGPELGWVDCSFGKTRVIAYVEAKMVKPQQDRPYEGIMSITSEISPMASSEYEQGRTSEEEVIITRMLDKVLRWSDALDKESLCIVAGQRVWHLRLTFHFLADAGNMIDCACLAGIVALRHFRKPEVEVEGDRVIVHSPDTRAPQPLAIHHTPICLTFALYSYPPITSSTTSAPISSTPSGSFSTHKTYALLDPSTLEYNLAHGMFSIAMNVQKDICVLQKNGGVPLDQGEVMKLCWVAADAVAKIDELIEKRLKEDWDTKSAKLEVR